MKNCVIINTSEIKLLQEGITELINEGYNVSNLTTYNRGGTTYFIQIMLKED